MASPAVNLSADKGPLVLRSIYPCAAAATLAVVARFTSRKLMRVQWAVDDYAVLVCLVLTWGVTVSLHFCVIYGGGKHIKAISAPDQVRFLKSIYALNEIYISTTPSIKVAALLMYRRIFTTPRFWTVVYIFLALVGAWWFAETVAAIFLCMPINGWWDRPVAIKCMSLRSFDLAFAVINITFDFFILLLPVNMLWRLQINNAQKVALTFIFMLGGLECVIAIVRLLSAIIHIDDEDFSWVITDTLVWTAAECSVGVISVCLPTLRPLVSLVIPKQISCISTSRRKKSRKYEKTDPWRRESSFTRLQGSSILHAASHDLHKNEITAHPSDSNIRPYDAEDGIKVTTELEMYEMDKPERWQPVL
ncbi:MAG: hypothetical protein LQ338_003476 [Usnochroma carphineum]|nr:MAG: hypothetical protein LQ338_003476 [Usnochroma carphineum]